MKLQLQTSHIKLMSRSFGKIIPNRITIAVLAHVLFRHDDVHGLTASATNLDEELTLRLPGEVVTDSTGPQSFLVPYAEIKRLASVMKKDEPVMFEPGKDTVFVNTLADGRTLTREITSQPVEEFPVVKDMPGNAVSADIAAFLAGYRTVLRAASPDPSRAVLSSVFWNHTERALIATDGRRLSMLPLSDFPVDTDLIVPPVKASL